MASTEQSINLLIDDFRRSNLTGIANNMNLSIGFNSFLDLIDEIQLHLNKFQLCDLIKLQNTMLNYFNSIGLNDNKSNDFDSAKQALHKLIDFRSKIRTIALGNIKSPDKDRDFAKQMLSYCDDIREQLKREQIFLVDKKV